eukprot:gene13887-biopygen3554
MCWSQGSGCVHSMSPDQLEVPPNIVPYPSLGDAAGGKETIRKVNNRDCQTGGTVATMLDCVAFRRARTQGVRR